MAVLSFRIWPAVNLRFDAGWTQVLRKQLAQHPLSVSLPVMLYVLMLFAAILGDQCDMYTVDRPHWLKPQPGTELRTDLLRNFRLRTGFLRMLYVVPEFVIYTRAQLAHSLALALAMNVLVVLLLFNKRQCSSEAVAVAGVCAALASAAAMCCRLLFKGATFNGDARYAAAYRSHKREYQRRLLGALALQRASLFTSGKCYGDDSVGERSKAAGNGCQNLGSREHLAPELATLHSEGSDQSVLEDAPVTVGVTAQHEGGAAAASQRLLGVPPEAVGGAHRSSPLVKGRNDGQHTAAKRGLVSVSFRAADSGTAARTESVGVRTASPCRSSCGTPIGTNVQPSRARMDMGELEHDNPPAHDCSSLMLPSRLASPPSSPPDSAPFPLPPPSPIPSPPAQGRKSSSIVAHTAVLLRPNQLTVSLNRRSVGFWIPELPSAAGSKHDHAVAEASSKRFVSARHVGVAASSLMNPFSTLLVVQVDRSAIPADFVGGDVIELPSNIKPPLSRYACGWRLAVAWALNLAVLATAWFIALCALSTSSEADEETLHASGQKDEEWRAVLVTGIILACVESFVIIDAIKVFVLTGTSSHALERALPPRTGRRRLLRKPLRRLHLVIDTML